MQSAETISLGPPEPESRAVTTLLQEIEEKCPDFKDALEHHRAFGQTTNAAMAILQAEYLITSVMRNQHQRFLIWSGANHDVTSPKEWRDANPRTGPGYEIVRENEMHLRVIPSRRWAPATSLRALHALISKQVPDPIPFTPPQPTDKPHTLSFQLTSSLRLTVDLKKRSWWKGDTLLNVPGGSYSLRLHVIDTDGSLERYKIQIQTEKEQRMLQRSTLADDGVRKFIELNDENADATKIPDQDISLTHLSLEDLLNIGRDLKYSVSYQDDDTDPRYALTAESGDFQIVLRVDTNDEHTIHTEIIPSESYQDRRRTAIRQELVQKLSDLFEMPFKRHPLVLRVQNDGTLKLPIPLVRDGVLRSGVFPARMISEELIRSMWPLREMLARTRYIRRGTLADVDKRTYVSSHNMNHQRVHIEWQLRVRNSHGKVREFRILCWKQ